MIASVSNQNYPSFECILIDDGSTDNSFDYVNQLIQQDKRFRNESRPESYKRGGRGSKNYGFTLSAGKYIVFFDSDDIMEPDYLASRVDYLENNQEKDGVVSDFYWRVRPTDIKKRIYTYNRDIFQSFKLNVQQDWFWLNYMDYRFWFNPGNPMWRRVSLADKPMWDENTAIGEDHEYHARLMLQGLDIGIINGTTWNYMANDNSMMTTSEAISPLLSRSYGKMLVIRHILHYLGNRPCLTKKELVCQVKFLRRIVACKDEIQKKKVAIQTMLDRIKELMELLNYSAFQKKYILFVLKYLIFFHDKTGKGYSFYTLLIYDNHPTTENKYFQIS